MAAFKVDLFTNPHKDLRKLMFDTSIMVANADVCDKSQLLELEKTVKEMVCELRKHARSENTYAHPIIGKKVPDMRDHFAAEHLEHEAELANLEIVLESLSSSLENEEKRRAIGLEFYRALNRFIAGDLFHQDAEETNMRSLWELCTDEELFAIMIAFMANEEPENFSAIFQLAHANIGQAGIDEMLRIINVTFDKSISAIVLAAVSNVIV